jgi:hypothetical protein
MVDRTIQDGQGAWQCLASPRAAQLAQVARWPSCDELVSVRRPTTQGPSMMLYTLYAAHIHAPSVDYNNIRSTYGRSQPIRLDPTPDLVEGRFKRTRTESWEAEAVPEVAAAT